MTDKKLTAKQREALAIKLANMGLEYDVDKMYILEEIVSVLKGEHTNPSLNPESYK